MMRIEMYEYYQSDFERRRNSQEVICAERGSRSRDGGKWMMEVGGGGMMMELLLRTQMSHRPDRS